MKKIISIALASTTLLIPTVSVTYAKQVYPAVKYLGNEEYEISSVTGSKDWATPLHMPSPPAGVEFLQIELTGGTFANNKQTITIKKGGWANVHATQAHVYLKIFNDIRSARFVASVLDKPISKHVGAYVYPFPTTSLAADTSMIRQVENYIERFDTPSAGYVDSVDAYAFRGRTVFKFGYRESQAQLNQVKMDVAKIDSRIIKPDMDVYEKEFAVHNWIAGNVAYDNSKNGVYDTDYTAVTKRKTECAGIAELTYQMLAAAGLKSRIVTGYAHAGSFTIYGRRVAEVLGSGQGTSASHAWNEVDLNGNWYMLDVSGDLASQNYGVIGFDFYNLTSSQLAQTHTWNHAMFPVANTNFANVLEHSKNPQDKQILKTIMG